MPKGKIPTMMIRTEGRRHIKTYSYVAVLTEKGGSEVKAIRFDGYERATDVMNDCPPGWNIRAVYKLSEEDFKE